MRALKSFIFLLLFLQTEIIFGDTITVRQDGTGDFTIIQDAINASTDGDTILVYPGTYYENLNFNGKSITLASLNLLTNDPNYINQTIIDGNYSGSCIRVESHEAVIIHGLKITHGSGTSYAPGYHVQGGGARIIRSNVEIINCLITENKAGSAGGIQLVESQAFLSGTTISHNEAISVGGGIVIATDSTEINVAFDSVHRCNIFLNFAGKGCDIYKNYSIDTMFIVLDTFTVMIPDDYHIYEFDRNLNPTQKLKTNIQHAKIDAVAADLYVSPEGSNDNSGLSPDQSLRNISFALAKIISSADSSRTIHLANGIYSSCTNQEIFPINLRNYINIQGENRDSTILDADSLSYLMEGSRLEHKYTIGILTLQRGNGLDGSDHTGGICLELNYDVTFKDLLIQQCCHYSGSAFNNGSSAKITFENVEVRNCRRGYCALRVGGANSYFLGLEPDSVQIINCKIHHNGPGEDSESGPGGGIDILGKLYDQPEKVFLINCEVTDNLAIAPSNQRVEAGILADDNAEVYLINCTVGNNTASFNETNTAIGIQYFCKMHIINSIIYGNTPRQICISNPDDSPSELYIKYSLLQGGEDSILNWSPANVIYYDPVSNLNTDPLWDTASMYPYSLSEGSPCIDAGTLDLPPGIELPEYDIAGNPRVWGESVDMGAYEYGPWVKVPGGPDSRFQIPDSRLLEVSPNPFRFGTYISYELKQKGKLNISVYSLSGMKVVTLIDLTGLPSETGKFYWDGHNREGNDLPAGTYVLRMTLDDNLVETVKLVKSE